MSETFFLGIDMGGTHMRTALVNLSGMVVRRRTVPSGIEEGAGPCAERLVGECRRQIQATGALGARVAAVGLGVAGKVDPVQGRVIFSPNLMDLNGYPLALELQDRLGLPVTIENDANAFGIGEHWVGAGSGIRNWVGVTLGTGVGGCLILNGRLWTGDGLGFAGEIGHTVIQPDGPLCACGLRGCLESHASGRALVEGVAAATMEGSLREGRLYELWKGNALTPREVYQCAVEGDTVARRLFQRMGWALGLALANLFSVLAIRHAVIGGGVANAWDQFIEPLRKSISSHSCMLDRDSAVVLRGRLGDDAALIGAARLAAACSPGHFLAADSL